MADHVDAESELTEPKETDATMRTGHTPEGRERLRAAARITRPWEHSTGPKTAEGKARSSANGRSRQASPRSKRELKREMAAVAGLDAAIAKMRAALIAPE